MDYNPSDPMPLDGDIPLTHDEVRRLRKVLIDADRASWARRQIGIIAPILVAVVVGVWQVWEWVVRHIRFAP